jgi:hypothetical protein
VKADNMYAVGMHVPLFSADLLLILICVQIAGSSLSSHSSHALCYSKGLEAIDCSHETSHQPTTDATTALTNPTGELFPVPEALHCLPQSSPSPNERGHGKETRQGGAVSRELTGEEDR